MSSSCYIFSPLFLLPWFSQVVTNFTFTSETYVILLLFKFVPSNAAKKLLVKNVEHKVEKTFSDSIRVVQLGRFILLSVSTSQQLPRLTSLYFFTFLKWPLKLDCTFPWQQSSGSENFITPEAGNFYLTSNKIQSILHAIWTRVIYTLIFAASIECPDSTTLTVKNTSFPTF